MSTVHQLPEPAGPSIDTDATIAATIKGLIAGKGLSVAALGRRVGIPTSTMYYKLGAGFSAAEVADLAAALNVPVADLYSGLDGLFWCAARDSNPEPADYVPATVTDIATRRAA